MQFIFIFSSFYFVFKNKKSIFGTKIIIHTTKFNQMKKQKTAEKPTKQAEKRNLIEGQKCVMLGVVVNTDNTKAFEKWFKKELGMRIEYVTQYETLRDTDNGYDVEGTGGRSDVIFYLHKEDIMKMVTRRFGIDVKWWEDMVDNNSDIIPEEILNTNLKYS